MKLLVQSLRARKWQRQDLNLNCLIREPKVITTTRRHLSVKEPGELSQRARGKGRHLVYSGFSHQRYPLLPTQLLRTQRQPATSVPCWWQCCPELPLWLNFARAGGRRMVKKVILLEKLDSSFVSSPTEARWPHLPQQPLIVWAMSGLIHACG